MDWLDEELGGFDDDYLIFDCPGKPKPQRQLLYLTPGSKGKSSCILITHSSQHLFVTSVDSVYARARHTSSNRNSWRININFSGMLTLQSVFRRLMFLQRCIIRDVSNGQSWNPMDKCHVENGFSDGKCGGFWEWQKRYTSSQRYFEVRSINCGTYTALTLVIDISSQIRSYLCRHRAAAKPKPSETRNFILLTKQSSSW